MKTLYLVRHAKSSWDNPALKDFDRPLNSRGQKDAPNMGKRLATKKVAPDLLLSSPANRAYTTASIIAQHLHYPPDDIKTDETIFHADLRELLEVLSSQDGKIESLMLFGHNPGFTDLANFLTEEDIENIPTCGVLAISFEIKDWKTIGETSGQVLFYDYPKKPFNSKFLS